MIKKEYKYKTISQVFGIFWITTILLVCFFTSFSDVLNSFTTDDSFFQKVIDFYDYEYDFIWSLFYKIWFKCLLLVLFVYFYLTFKTENIKKISDELTNSLTKVLFNKVSLIIGFLSLILVLIGFFNTNSYLITNHIHDLFIPQIGAYAIKHGLSLHKDLHTPFGFIYNTLNYFSLLIIESFPKVFDIFDMIMLSSLLFSVVIISLFFLIRINIGKKETSLWFILLFILSICFQSRDINNIFNGRELHWAGSYNSHLWALLSLQMIHLFLLEKNPFQKKLKWTKNKFYLFTLIQFLCIYISFNYKFSFFLGSMFLFCSAFLLIPSKKRTKFLLISSSLFLFLTACHVVFFNYHLIEYLKDLQKAAVSKNTIYVNIKHLVFFMTLFFFIRNYKFLFASHPNRNISTFIKKSFQKSVFFIKENKVTLIKQIIFDCFIGLSILIGIEGDFQKPFVYILIIPTFYLLISKRKSLLKKFSYSFLMIVFFINIFSLSRFFIVNFYEGKFERLERKSKIFF